MIKYLPILLATLLYSMPITPIPTMPEYDKEKAALGKALFFDSGLSVDGSVSCASCHQLPGNGANLTPYSFGVNGATGTYNSPTVLNSVYNFVQFWDGRSANLVEQVRGPITNPNEMATTMKNVVAYVRKQPHYVKAFHKLYDEGITEKTVAKSLAEFEKALTTPNSRFDQFLRGNKTALTDLEKQGYVLFKDDGCISCHNGRNIGGNMFQKIGVIIPYTRKGKGKLGRFDVTGREDDKMVFKVPTLRNISKTPPYLHDGTSLTLEDAIKEMFKHQLGRVPDESTIKALIAFLKTLDGDSPAILRETP